MIDALIVSNVVLWVLLVVLAIVVFALVRQLGVLHERITPVGALLQARGLNVGEPAPEMTVTDLSGSAHVVGGKSQSGRHMLLVFVSPACPVCKALLPVLKSTRLSDARWLDIVLASDGPEEEHRRYVVAQSLRDFPYVLSAELGRAFQVGSLPFAAIVDAEGVLRARGLINSREHLESLFEAQRRGVASLQEFMQNQGGARA